MEDKKRKASAISGGIFLISLGVLLATGWWWPGIMIAICAIPIVVAIIQATQIPWTVVIALVLVGIGVITLVKAFYLREE
jgi:hypothetical protein